MLELRKFHEYPDLSSQTISSIHIRTRPVIRGYLTRLHQSILEDFNNSGIFHEQEEDGNAHDELTVSTDEMERPTLNTGNQINIEELSFVAASEDTLHHVSRVHK